VVTYFCVSHFTRRFNDTNYILGCYGHALNDLIFTCHIIQESCQDVVRDIFYMSGEITLNHIQSNIAVEGGLILIAYRVQTHTAT